MNTDDVICKLPLQRTSMVDYSSAALIKLHFGKQRGIMMAVRRSGQISSCVMQRAMSKPTHVTRNIGPVVCCFASVALPIAADVRAAVIVHLRVNQGLQNSPEQLKLFSSNDGMRLEED